MQRAFGEHQRVGPPRPGDGVQRETLVRSLLEHQEVDKPDEIFAPGLLAPPWLMPAATHMRLSWWLVRR